jgi:hypothetical protein
MKDVNVPFSLYDFFAILFPGLFGVISIYLFIDPSLHSLNIYLLSFKSINDFILAIILIVFCYFVGHIFNALSQLIVERTATRFLGWAVNNYLATHGVLWDKGIRGFVIKDGRLRFPKRIFEYAENGKPRPVGALIKSCVEVSFGKINNDYGYTYRLIQAYVTQFAPNSAAEAKTFTATAAMYENLTVTFALIGIAFLKGILSNQIGANISVAITAISFALSILCFNSSRRYKRMWVETNYAAFVVAVKSQRKTRKSS